MIRSKDGLRRAKEAVEGIYGMCIWSQSKQGMDYGLNIKNEIQEMIHDYKKKKTCPHCGEYIDGN